jgi:hypothetical protein
MRRGIFTIGTLSVAISSLFVGVAMADRINSTNYVIDASVAGNFGGSTGSSSYQLTSSGGESIAGNGSGGSYKIGYGYISNLEKSLSLTVQPSGLVGYWPFDEGSGSVAYDASINSHNGTYSTGSGFYAGKVGSWAWSDSAGTQYVTVPNNAQLPSGNHMTVSAWVRHTATADDAIATEWQYGSGPGNGAWALQTTASGAQLRFFLRSNSSDPGNNYVDTTNASMTTNTWYHVTAVYDGTQAANVDRVKIYLNGVELSKTVTGTIATTLTSNTANFVIGDFPDLVRQWSGAIDEVKLYNRSLSQSEVAAEYTAGNAGIASGLSLGAITPGTSNTALSDIVVQTDSGGYTLAISENNDLTNGAYTIPAVLGSIASPVAWSEGTTKGLGFTLTATNATALPGTWSSGNSYAAVPTTATSFYTRTGIQSSTSDYITMRLRADAPLTQAVGVYKNTLTITGTITP